MHRALPAKHTDQGLRALSKDTPIRPESVQRYLEGKFGDTLDDAHEAMMELARSLAPTRLAERAWELYEKFRPEIPPGKRGWVAEGKLDLESIRTMARQASLS